MFVYRPYLWLPRCFLHLLWMFVYKQFMQWAPQDASFLLRFPSALLGQSLQQPPLQLQASGCAALGVAGSSSPPPLVLELSALLLRA
mmetsp:Transcript_63187/g.176752  ORF Transcript_63187/g.176752 Transcript_63187/m.176752 type:complete len:87 (-) Transcript_63187:86-346(-)